MNINYKDETFLARWIANELSAEELKEFQKTEAYHQFKAIDDASLLLKTPSYNKKEVFNKIMKNIEFVKTNKKVVKLIPTWLYGAVASIALLISFLYFNNSTSNFSTNYGEQLTITLPDNSKAHLSPKSTITYKKQNWNDRRELSLKGKAFFEVKKGESFTVQSNGGNVTVLGTKFTVNTSENYFEVKCYEGKVKVTSKNKEEIILTKGKAYRNYSNSSEKWGFVDVFPSWIKGESSFNNTPLLQVIKALENQFKLKFDASKIDTSQRFTGTFTHEDVDIALQTVFAPMKISYKLAENSSVILTYK
ncbi:FecR domain-containing protein [Tenacibaculum sp. 1_MG-2023]|uniref:FecR family protein n=1 Tax=Tenacibaculum sp. 1_MG-2023 TaxID=3062653 RepID=UPI0026E198C3|nr:FecR family protein [Tenacibaculum sp. 1_MG-2023]MDO6676752.1 FecR domain-containing protein [Tenacibaculum sp. 1_MG-2023]